MAETVSVLLVIFVIVLLFYLRYMLGEFRIEQTVVQKYRLFKIRDHLVRLVVEEKISESDPAFQFIYDGLNTLIQAKRGFNLREVIEVSRAAARKAPEKSSAVAQALMQGPPEIRGIALEFFQALLQLIVLKSVLVKTAVRIGLAGYQFTHGLRKVLSVIFKEQDQAYELYRELEQSSQSIRCRELV